MGQKGSNTTTSSSAPNPVAASDYYNLLNQAQGVAATPYSPYTGQLVSPVNQQQQTGIGGINANANYAQPFIQQAAQYANNAAQPITSQQIQNYESPYTSQVVNATENQFQNTNAQQQQQVLGNAAAQGALGGNRVGVAQAVLAGQQQTAEAPVIAGLENTGYNTALQTALQEQQNQGQAAYSLGNLGVSGENAALTGANAQVGAGTLEQQTGQAQDTAAYQQYEQALAYPFQTTQWLAGLDTGVGSQLGGTSETTGPAPNPLNAILGLGAAGIGAVGNYYQGAGAKFGGRIKGYDTGGAPYGGGAPYSGGVGWVPSMNITAGRGAPPPPNMPGQQTAGQMMQQAAGLANAVGKSRYNSSPKSFTPDLGYAEFNNGTQTGIMGVGPTEAGAIDPGTANMPLPGLDAGDYEEGGYRRGGHVPIRGGLGLSSFLRRRHFDSGGGAPYDPDYMDETFAAPIQHTGPNYDIASNPQAMAQYSALASRDAMSGAGIGPSAAYGQGNPYVPLPQPRQAAADNDDSLPPQITGGVASAPQDEPSAPMAYTAPQGGGGLQAPAPEEESAPQAAPQRKGLFGLSPDFYTSLMAAGLGMAASRSPFVGEAIGQGGLQGLSEYGSLQQQHLAQQKQQQDVDLKVKQLNQQAKAEQDRVAAESRPYEQMNAAQKAEMDFRQRSEQRQEMQPVKIGTDMSTGTDIYAVRDPSVQGGFRRIDPTALGNNAGTPSGTGAPVTPQPNAPAVPTSQEQLPATAEPTAGEAPPNVRAEVLQSLEPQMASQIKALDEGRMQFPTGFALKSPYWQNMLRLVSNYDPSFDAVNYNARAKTRADFTAGKSAQNITSFNTAIGHLDTLDQSIDGLGNTRFGWLNPMLQGAKSAMGDTDYQMAQKRFAAARQAVTDELTRAFRGSGGNVHDIVGWENTLNQADSPQAMHAAVKTAVNLLQSRIESVGDQYNRGMGTTRDPLTLLSPHAAAAVQRLSGEAPQTAAIDPRDASALKANATNPDAAAAIDKKYGAGTARRILGGQ